MDSYPHLATVHYNTYPVDRNLVQEMMMIELPDGTRRGFATCLDRNNSWKVLPEGQMGRLDDYINRGRKDQFYLTEMYMKKPAGDLARWIAQNPDNPDGPIRSLLLMLNPPED